MKNLPKKDNQFYPTPIGLAIELRSKIKWDGVNVVCDPSAGKGDLLDLPDNWKYSRIKKWAIEIDPNLQAILRSTGHMVIGSDFLSFDGCEQPDVFLMNPPFAEGAAHLLRAINYMYSGQIACILNAETLRNPYSNERKLLAQELERLGATIEYKSNAFLDAERKTGVEIAIVYIDKRVSNEESIFAQCKDQSTDIDVDEIDGRSTALVQSDRIKAIVERYNDAKERGIKLILEFFQKSSRVPFVSLVTDGLNVSESNRPDQAALAKLNINQYLLNLRSREWRDLMQDESIEKFLTKKKKEQYRQEIEAYSSMDITESNIRAFVAHVSAGYSDALTEATLALFEKFTSQHSWYPETKNNIYLFNGWKTNNAFKVNKKVILPNYRAYEWGGMRWESLENLNDFDKIMSYFDGGRQPVSETNPSGYVKLSTVVEAAIKAKVYQKIESEYFIATFYQKGTLHLQFRNPDILRRFNVFCCINRGDLPFDYAQREYGASEKREKAVVESFEGSKNYKVDESAQPFKKAQALHGSGLLAICNN